MDEHEKKLLELTEKAQELDSTLKAASFRMLRTRKTIRNCRDVCKSTNELIGELNATK